MKFSVVTPSFNQAEFIERTLASVHRQTGDFELEHFVIDGGSTDGTVDLLRRWDDKLSYVSEPDNGQSHALNKGIACATGDIIVWLNSDDILFDGALRKVAAFFSAHPEARWLYGKAKLIDEHDREIRKPITWYKNLLLRRYSYSLLLVENFISQVAVFFHRSLYNEVGGVDEALKYDMDYDLWLKFGRICRPGILDRYLGAFRFYTGCKTGGDIEKTLLVANQIAVKHARAIGKGWLGSVNYWWYYKRTNLIYQLLAEGQRDDSQERP